MHTVQDSTVNENDYVDVGLACAVLGRGLEGRRLSELSGSVLDAISQLTTSVGSAVVGLGASLTVLLV